ncbi:aldehyde dehydrogenase family protein [Sphingomonas solaris]|uniref:Aldehyde dehydrogenase family protein n=1 Tax=Alterirhizorhabdus solaris TaxID=2529389 RepID=A0A558RBB2_9SPHN|nr:aldehyde dehydrogenase family protein [Sphingomonas solaris]TVV76651.1 aldehyde dehydrogenase family protein [Sphingomonas solaris]
MATAVKAPLQAALATDMLIDGQLVPGEGAPMTVYNPSTGGVTVTVPGASVAQFAQAIAAARAAADKGEWAGLPQADRIAAVRRYVDLLVARSDELKALIVTETGIPVKSMVLGAQVDGPLNQMKQMLDLYARLPEVEENPLSMDERINPMGGFIQSLRLHVPVGVVAAVSAYNFPLHISLWKLMTALVTGNSVILRPSPLTPLSALALGESAIEAGIPAGVVHILAEAGADGALLLTTDPAVDMVSFTGSTEVGSKVAAQAAPSMKRLQLELGGKSAVIVLPDRIEAAFHAAITVCMSHAGQGCVLGTRVFVPEAEKPKVLAAMKASLAHAKIGDSDDPATTMGPVISEAQVQRCERYVRLAVEAGATVVAGGKRADRPGYFFEPTVLDLPDNKNPAAQDEIFGPVVGVIGYRDVEHAIEMANDSPLGLSGYVHGKDARQALAVARRLRTGTVNVNAFMGSANASSGGHKMSGIGRERGVEGIRAFQEIQVVNLGSAG